MDRRRPSDSATEGSSSRRVGNVGLGLITTVAATLSNCTLPKTTGGGTSFIFVEREDRCAGFEPRKYLPSLAVVASPTRLTKRRMTAKLSQIKAKRPERSRPCDAEQRYSEEDALGCDAICILDVRSTARVSPRLGASLGYHKVNKIPNSSAGMLALLQLHGRADAKPEPGEGHSRRNLGAQPCARGDFPRVANGIYVAEGLVSVGD
jgi:hypothetical protein